MINTFGIPIIPQNDADRLQALEHYQILEADVQESFDNIAFIMAKTFDMPIALISLVDKDEVVFKGNAGMEGVSKTSRGISVCALAVLNEEAIVFENAAEEECLIANPLVVGDFGLQFYAGAPLTTVDGYNIGTVCLVDKRPRTFSAEQKKLLERFAKMVMNEIELRLDAKITALNHAQTIERQRNDLLIREAQMTLAQEMAGMASWEWELPGTIIKWSPEMYKFWGFEDKEIEVTLDTVAAMTHKDELGNLQQAIQSVMQGKDVEIQYRRYDKSGKEIFIYTKTFIQKDKNGNPLSVFGIDMDITSMRAIQDDLRKQNQKLLDANTELASFNYIASHDLKEPLRKIQTFSNRIAHYEKDKFSEKAQFYFSRIVDAAERMQELIDSLLIFSKLTNSSPELHFVETDLNLIVLEVENKLSEAIAEKQAHITKAPLPVIKGLPLQLEQVFLNIISNALNYAQEGIAPHIDIRLEKIAGENIQSAHNFFWKIDIADNGIGFDSIYEEKIFEIFQRLNSKTSYKGTGVGLAICKKIMHIHNGDIKAKGLLGQGAIFTLYFPA